MVYSMPSVISRRVVRSKMQAVHGLLHAMPSTHVPKKTSFIQLQDASVLFSVSTAAEDIKTSR